MPTQRTERETAHKHRTSAIGRARAVRQAGVLDSRAWDPGVAEIALSAACVREVLHDWIVPAVARVLVAGVVPAAEAVPLAVVVVAVAAEGDADDDNS